MTGTLSPRSRDAKDGTAAWHDGTLSLLLREESGRVVIEDYDLDAGELAGTTEVSGLDGVLDGRSYLERIAVVGR